jgi:hypothetical protein
MAAATSFPSEIFGFHGKLRLWALPPQPDLAISFITIEIMTENTVR